MPEILFGVLIAAAIALYLLWLLLTEIWEFTTERVANLWNDLTGETARRKRREEEARTEEKERKQRQRKSQHAAEIKEKERKQKLQHAAEKERERFCTKNSEVFSAIAYLLSTCRAPAVEIMRAAGAIEGEKNKTDPKAVIWMDVGFILTSFSKTGSTGGVYIRKVWKEVTRSIEPPDVDGVPPLSVLENQNYGVEQLVMVPLLAMYDKQRGTTLSSNAASSYLSIVSAVSSHCGSLAAKMVADKYTELLNPYIHDSGGNGYAGSSTSSAGNHSGRKSVCEKCLKDFELLGLPLGASDEEVKSKRRAFAELLHDDRLGAMSDTARRIALEQHQSVNEACDHILKCPARAKLNDDINGNGSRPASHQSTKAKKTRKKAKHQTSPASSSDAYEMEKQEQEHKVQSEQDLIGAACKKVDEATKITNELLEQMKKRRQTSLERF